jgi:predicted nucleic acid-binding Zn ribbon protein
MNYRSSRSTGKDPQDPRKIGETLDALTKRLGLAPPDSLSKVFAGWEGLVGDLLASHLRPVGLRDGVLTVEVTEPAWATQLKFLGDDLVRRVNEQVGAGTVTSLSVRVVGARRGPRSAD